MGVALLAIVQHLPAFYEIGYVESFHRIEMWHGTALIALEIPRPMLIARFILPSENQHKGFYGLRITNHASPQMD